MRSAEPLSPATYARHPLHLADRGWPESNCYVDLWIELLHAHGHEPLAALPFTFTADFEGDGSLVPQPINFAMFEPPRIVIGFVAHPRNSTGYCCGSLRAADARMRLSACTQTYGSRY